MAKLTGSQIIINLLRQNGIDVAFGLPGGMILPVAGGGILIHIL